MDAFNSRPAHSTGTHNTMDQPFEENFHASSSDPDSVLAQTRVREEEVDGSEELTTRILIEGDVCHHCHKVLSKPLVCAACKTAFYCGKECQHAAWKKGHREECKKIIEARKEEKVKQKAIVEQLGAPNAGQFLDGNLDTDQLWYEGIQLVQEEQYEEAVWKCAVSVLLNFYATDFSCFVEKLGPLFMAVEQCRATNDLYPILLALTLLMEHHDSTHIHRILDLVDRFTDDATGDYIDSAESLDQVDCFKFGCGMCYMIAARILSAQAITQIPSKQINMRREYFQKVQKIVIKVRKCMDANRWLFVQSELGIIAFESAALAGRSLDESRIWLTKFSEGFKSVKEYQSGDIRKHLKFHQSVADMILKKRIPLVELAFKEGNVFVRLDKNGKEIARYGSSD